MQVPPEPVDAIVAEILVRRFLQAAYETWAARREYRGAHGRAPRPQHKQDVYFAGTVSRG